MTGRPSRRVCLCVHPGRFDCDYPGGVTVCPSRWCILVLIQEGVPVTTQGGVTVCPSREVWLCAHPAGATVCPSRRCDCASIKKNVIFYPGGCD